MLPQIYANYPAYETTFAMKLKRSFFAEYDKYMDSEMRCHCIEWRKERSAHFTYQHFVEHILVCVWTWTTSSRNSKIQHRTDIWLFSGFSSFFAKWVGGDPVNRFNHTSLMVVGTQIEHPYLARNLCVIEVFGCVFALFIDLLII